MAATVIVAFTGCRGCSSAGRNGEVVVYTSVDQVFSLPVFEHCEEVTGLRVRAVYDTEETKSTGVLNRLLAESSHPMADVFWSGDPVRPFVLIDRGLVEPYQSTVALGIPESLRAKDGMWTGLAARARVLLVNSKRVNTDSLPRSIRDLADPRWRGQTAIANPLFGTTTMHVAALFDAWGEGEARRFLNALKANDVRVASSNGEVKRLVVSGDVAFGLTDTDDAHEAIESGASVAVVYPDQDALGTLVMPTSVVLIKGGPHSQSGRRFIDCLLSGDVERRMAESAAHMPLRVDIRVPDGVRGIGTVRAMVVDYRLVAQRMVQLQPWLREWVGL